MKRGGLLKVLSYNIHKGMSVGNLKFTLREIREAIRSIKPDLICMQEVLGRHERHRIHIPTSPDLSQFEYLAEGLWPHFSYGKNAAYPRGHHGNAILSRFPIESSDNLDVSSSRLERRGLLHAVLILPERANPLHVICFHLSLREKDRKAQIARLCDRIDAGVPQGAPLIVAGDSNDWRTRLGETLQSRVKLEEAFESLHGEHAKTYPALLPVLRLDRIYYRGLRPRRAVCLSGPPWSGISDHAAILAEFEI